MFFSLGKKKIKYSIVICFSILIVGVVFYVFYEKNTSDNINAEYNQPVSEASADLEMKVTLISHYIVGADFIENKVEYVKSLDELKNLYSEWDLVEAKDSNYTFERHIEDISPECKKGTYFSISSDGYLTLFSGNPINKSTDNKIIETFFRIDIKKLKSMLPIKPIQELYGGILINDRAEFNSVLSTFSEFAIE